MARIGYESDIFAGLIKNPFEIEIGIDILATCRIHEDRITIRKPFFQIINRPVILCDRGADYR